MPDIEVLTCRVVVASRSKGFGERRTSACGAAIGATRQPVAFTGRVLDDVRYVESGCVTAWCRKCGKATEYRYLTALDQAA